MDGLPSAWASSRVARLCAALADVRFWQGWVRPASEGTAPSQEGQPVGFLVRSIGGDSVRPGKRTRDDPTIGPLASMWFWLTGQSTNTLPNMS